MRRFIALGLAGLCAPLARAEIEASLDLRLVESNGDKTYLDGGLGKLRYDNSDDGLQLGRARFAWRDFIGGDWHANVDLSAWSLHDHNAVDVTEAFLEWRPVPKSEWRSNLKIGAFYPPISLEHRASGWTNPYTISSSALNTWVGEELRTIGIGYELKHMGIANGGAWDYGVNAAVYEWNDPAGVILAFRGFSLNDRQTPVFGRIGTYAFGGREQRVLFSEIDNRPGYYVGGYAKHDSGIEARALHYDNRADPTVYKASISDYGWRTRFNSLGMRYDGPAGVAVIAQRLKGTTDATPNPAFHWAFETSFLLVAREFGRHRFAARYDDFKVWMPSMPAGDEYGHAWTVGWTWKLQKHLELSTEWLQINSDVGHRAALGLPTDAREHSLQMAVRMSL